MLHKNTVVLLGIELWRDKDQTRGGKPIIWVVLHDGRCVEETLNAAAPHTDPAAACLFAHAEAARLGVPQRASTSPREV